MVRFAWLLSLAVGFLSLSQEILWVRVVSFVLKGIAQSFALVLFFFLVGIAVGSAVGKRFCERHTHLLRSSAAVLAIAGLLDVGLVMLLPPLSGSRAIGLPIMLVCIALTAGLKGVMFPIAHHLGSQQSGARIGRSVSKVYFGNIVGSTLGPIVTGYILLNQFSAAQCMALIGVGTAALALACALRAHAPAVGLAAAAVLAPVTLFAWAEAPRMVPEIGLNTDRSAPGRIVDHVVENRHGIIHTVAEPDGTPDTVFGGNVYDGRVNTDVHGIDYNELNRALVLFAVHPDPARVLVVGMSTGAWARILSASPRIKHMTIVEINPGYLQLIRRYPEVAGLLHDPRVEVVIDDGRRWLRRNPGEKFDLIVQNNTFSWRAYSTNLLSREYMQLTAAHLKPGGIAAFNSTHSGDVLATARCVFPFVERRASFIYGSEADFSHPIADAERAYRELKLGGAPVFEEAAFANGGLAREMVRAPFVPRGNQFDELTSSPAVITDQNLLAEYAHGKIFEFMPGVLRVVNETRAALGSDGSSCGER
jgi:SAM-dependent methyltransferase